jgi:hypothetical protein
MTIILKIVLAVMTIIVSILSYRPHAVTPADMA